MLNYVGKLQRSSLVASTGKLLFYTVIGQLLSVAIAPFLSRLYSPESLGRFGIWLMYLLMVNLLTNLNFSVASPSPADDKEAAYIVVGASLLSVGMSCLLTGVFSALVALNLFGYGKLAGLSFILVAFGLVASSAFSILQYWCIRRSLFSAVGRAAVVQNASRAIVQLGLGAIDPSWISLAIGEVLGRIAGTALLFRASILDLLGLLKDVRLAAVYAALRKYRHFATVLLPPMLADQVLVTVNVPVISVLYGLGVGGQYFLMSRVLDIPINLVSRTVADAFYGRISEHARFSPHRIRPLLVRVFLILLLGGALILLPLMFWGKYLFAFAFGSNWQLAGELAAIMSPALLMNVATSPVARVFAVTRKPWLRYVYTITNVCGVVAIYTAAYIMKFGIVITVTGLSVISFVAYSGYFITAYAAANHIEFSPTDLNKQQ